MYVTGLLYPGLRKPQLYAATALTRYTLSYKKCIRTACSTSSGLNNWTLREFTDLYNAAVLNGMEHELPQDCIPVLRRCTSSDGQRHAGAVAFALNDAGNSNVKRLLLDGYRLFKRRICCMRLRMDGLASRRPSTRGNGSGIMSCVPAGIGRPMSCYGRRLAGASPYPPDKLTVAMTAYGHLLVDGGVSMYTSRWRAYQLLTRSHNTVLVDGRCNLAGHGCQDLAVAQEGDKPAGNDTIWHSAPSVDYCQGWWKGRWREYVDSQNPATAATKILNTVQHRRAVLFVKPDLWVILDTLLASDQEPHTAEVLYHIDAEQAESAENTVLATNKNKAGLLLAARPHPGLEVEIVTGKMEPPVQGWSANVKRNRPKGIPMSAIPTAIFRQSWKERADLVTLVHPFPNGEMRTTRCVALASSLGGQAARIDISPTEAYFWLHSDQQGKSSRPLLTSLIRRRC